MVERVLMHFLKNNLFEISLVTNNFWGLEGTIRIRGVFLMAFQKYHEYGSVYNSGEW